MTDAGRSIRLRVVGAVLGLAGLAIVVFAPAARLPLLTDDYTYLNRVQHPGWWHSTPTWGVKNEIFRPVLFGWFGLLHRLFGLHPLLFHLATGLLVLAAGVLTGLVAHRLGLRSGAYAAAAFFALHASMATPIGWTAAANSPLGVALVLGAIYCMLRPRVRRRDVLAACGLFAVALMTREVAAVAPPVLVITRYLVETGGSRPSRLWRAFVVSLPLWLVLFGYAAVRVLAGFRSSTGPYAQRVDFHGARNLQRLMAIATDLERFGDSSVYRVYVVVFWVALISICALASLRAHRSQGLIGLAWAVLGVMPVTFLAVHTMSYYYIDFALPGLATAVGTAFEWIADALPDRGRVGFAATCLVLLVALSSYTARQELHVYLELFADRTDLLVDQTTQDNPHPSKGSTIIVRNSDANTRAFSSQGDLFRVIFHDPSLKVVFGSPPTRSRPVVDPGAVAVVEGDTGTKVALLPVSLSEPSRMPVTVSWSTVNDIAVAPGDYEAASGTVVFAPGQTALTVPVRINGDTVPESNERLRIRFRDATNATIGGLFRLGFVTITNDD